MNNKSNKYKWDLRNIYKDENEFQKDFSAVNEMITTFGNYKETMLSDSKEFAKALMNYKSIERILTKLYEYASLSSDLDLANNHFLALKEKVINLFNIFSSESFFFEPNIIRLPEKKLKELLQQNDDLKPFKRTISCIRRYKKHTLSDECEKVLADISSFTGTHSSIRSVFANAELIFGNVKDEDGKKVSLNDTKYIPLMMSNKREVRRGAFRQLYSTYDNYGNTFASLLNGFVKEKTSIAKIRKFDSSLNASVFNDEVTSSIYNNLIETVNQNFEPLYQYYAIKKDMLNVSKLHLYDIYTPLITSCDRKYSYDEAVKMVLDTVSIFGKEYRDTLEDGLKNKNWVDVYPSDGKRGGAYSAGCYDTQPYILLNYSDTLDDVFTLGHEAGHSMHSYFSRKYNSPNDSEYTIFVAEVASTVNELLLAHNLLRSSNNTDEKLYLLDQLMNTYKGTLYRQTMFAEFERDIHKLVEDGEPLTKELLCDSYYKLNLKYFGPNVVCDQQIRNEWMRIPHFYYNFYVYKYATCISAASSIVKRIETEGDSYISKYINFLKCGNSMSPLESLAIADIDMNDPDVILSAINDFNKTVSEFKELINNK